MELHNRLHRACRLALQEGLPVERVRSSGVTVALHPNPETWRVRIWKSSLARSKKICSFEWTSPSGAYSKWGPHSSVPTFIRVWCASHVCSWTFVFFLFTQVFNFSFQQGLTALPVASQSHLHVFPFVHCSHSVFINHSYSFQRSFSSASVSCDSDLYSCDYWAFAPQSSIIYLILLIVSLGVTCSGQFWKARQLSWRVWCSPSPNREVDSSHVCFTLLVAVTTGQVWGMKPRLSRFWLVDRLLHLAFDCSCKVGRFDRFVCHAGLCTIVVWPKLCRAMRRNMQWWYGKYGHGRGWWPPAEWGQGRAAISAKQMLSCRFTEVECLVRTRKS